MEVEVLGSELRAARLQKELSLEEVEQELRIRAKFLRAIEAGDYSLLPSQVQARGFLRNYATFLSLDPNIILARYEQAMGQLDGKGPNGHLPEPTPVIVAKPVEPQYVRTPQAEGVYNEPTAPVRRRRRIFSPGVAVFLFAALGLIVAMAWGGTQLVEALITADQSADKGVEDFIDKVLGDQPTVTPSATFVPQATPTAAVEVAYVADGVQTIFDVTQRTWVRVTVDDEAVFEGIVRPGDRLQYQGKDAIAVRAGNAAGLDSVVNGIVVGPLGARGELVDTTFTRGFSNSPAPTATSAP
jgi:cytoskeletal protein RodZ